MIPSASSIVRSRYWLTMSIRIVAVGWLLFAMRFAPQDLFGMITNLFPSLNGGQPFGHYLLSNASTLFVEVVGSATLPLLLLFFHRRLVRFIIPTPKHACPHCGYSLSNLKSPFCPECGSDTRASP
jgi:rRNA maturation protein Nop10